MLSERFFLSCWIPGTFEINATGGQRERDRHNPTSVEH
jgi:hypothetical protein